MANEPRKHISIAARALRKQRARNRSKRSQHAQKLYDGDWRAYRAGFLSQPDNVLCRDCIRFGRTTPATVVDHIVPHQANEELFWDPANHQPLCGRCHRSKTCREDGGFGNRRKPRAS